MIQQFHSWVHSQDNGNVAIQKLHTNVYSNLIYTYQKVAEKSNWIH